MYHAPTRISAAIEAGEAEPKHGLFVGALFLLIALPYWGFRLLAHFLARDVKRLMRVVRVSAAAYSEALENDQTR